jgi:phosphohistidine phosphatase SixA
MLIIARHAPAAAPVPGGEDHARPLTSQGREVARALAAEWARLGPDHLVASPALRCAQTLEPLAALLGLGLELDEHLGPSAKPAQLAEALAYFVALEGTTITVTHAPQLRELVALLLEQQGIALDEEALHIPTGGYLAIEFIEDLRPARIEVVRRHPGPGKEPLTLVG